MGTPMSGSMIHLEPDGTSVWVALLRGKKLWVLFPPETDLSLLRTNSKSITEWFIVDYPKLKNNTNCKVYEHVQTKQEIIYVPHGWYHAVINLTTTVAISENVINKQNYLNVVQVLGDKEPELVKDLILYYN